MIHVLFSRYGVFQRPPRREKLNLELKEKIAEIYYHHKRRYGSPRIYRVLRKKGYLINLKRVVRLMRAMNLKAIQPRKFRVTTNSDHDLNIKENLLKREFDIDYRDKVWVSDITYIPTQEGWLYLAAVIDLYSRKVVGWSISTSIDAQLIISAIEMALNRRNQVKGLIFHSDRGSQYASHKVQNLLDSKGIRSSMSRKGDCWDNAVAESFFGTLKTELIYQNTYKTRKHAKLDIFEYIEAYFNKIRIHSYLNYMTPENYEKRSKVA